MRTTPDKITKLEPNEVFVFGSNLAGRHGMGAARDAMKFGAILGQGDGRQGKTYGICTKGWELEVLPPGKIWINVQRFLRHAARFQENTFLVTPIGCGLAGYKPSDIGPMFKNSTPNVILPACFLPYVGDR